MTRDQMTHDQQLREHVMAELRFTPGLNLAQIGVTVAPGE